MDRFSTHDAEDRDNTLEMLKRVFIVAEIVAKKAPLLDVIPNDKPSFRKHEKQESV
jgi:hypothetical protein